MLARVLVGAPSSRQRWPVVAPVAGALVALVVVVAALSLNIPGGRAEHHASAGHGSCCGQSRHAAAGHTAALSRDAEIVRERLRSVLHSFSVTPRADELVITAGNVAPPSGLG